MAGVPFDSIDGLATPESSSAARELILRASESAQARAEAENFLQRPERLLSDEAFRALRSAVRQRTVPGAVSGDLPGAFTRYARAAAALEAAKAKLDALLPRELMVARSALREASRKLLPPYAVFSAPGFSARLAAFLAEQPASGEHSQRNTRMRERDRLFLLYLQRIAAKNDTLSEFGPTGWGSIDGSSSGIQLSPESGIARRDTFLERWAAHALAAAINSDADVTSQLQVPALEPYAFDVLRRDVQAWPAGVARDKWLPIVEELNALPAQFAECSQPDDREVILDRARTSLADLGAERVGGERSLYSAMNPIGEECVRECNFRISGELINEVATQAEPWIDLWRDSYGFVASRVAAGLRQILELSAPDTRVMRLPAFFDACRSARLPLQGPGLVALATMAFLEVKAAMRERLRPHCDLAEYELTREDCHVVRNNFEYAKFDEYTYPSADLAIAARSPEAISRGDYRWVLAELHPPPALLHHCMYWACPDKPKLNAELAKTVNGTPSFHFGFFAADFTAHTTVQIFDALPELTNFVAPERPNPAWRRVATEDAEVFIDAESGDIGLRAATSGEYLGSFARAWVIPLGFHPFQFALAPHTPRLRCGDVVVQRRTWTVTLDEFPAGEYSGVSRELVIAVERLRAARELPRHIYIRPTEQALRRTGAVGRDKDTKPVYVDLESYLFLEIFHRWLKKAGELEITEMLPAPDQLCWLEADGRRTFELRTLIVPRV